MIEIWNIPIDKDVYEISDYAKDNNTTVIVLGQQVLEDTGMELEYDHFDVWLDDGMEDGVYSARELLKMAVGHVRTYDKERDHEIEMIIQAFDIEIGWDEAESALEDQGDVQSAIIEIRKLRG